MLTWIIEPRDPLIVRDARPFGLNPGARARSLPFPFPSTTTGGIRARAGLDDQGVFDDHRLDEVKAIEVRGPLLVEIDNQGYIQDWLLPAPADALLLNPAAVPVADDSPLLRQRLVPLALPPDSQTDLPQPLALVGLPRLPQDTNAAKTSSKPASKVPRYWRWAELQSWLEKPPDQDTVTRPKLGHSGPVAEQRVHVSINAATLSAIEGALFQTSGLEFLHNQKQQPSLTTTRLALTVQTKANLAEALAPLGGERRLMRWRTSQTPWPGLPATLKATIIQQKHCRLQLVTPACFTKGYQPTWLQQPQYGVTAQVKAAAVTRSQVVSGWDFEKDVPKPTRRLAPAGSVYFLALEGEDAAIAHWLETLWLGGVSDEAQDRYDGFGLAVFGTWSGQLAAMEEPT